jgi:large subunit ribosomal protein L22
MDIIAKTSVRVSTRKVRLVADAVRKLSIESALKNLAFVKNRGSVCLEKTLKSAIANAVNNNKLNQEDLEIKSIDVLEAPAYKRFHPSTRGRIHPYKRRGTNLTIILTEKKKKLVGKSETNSNDKKTKTEKILKTKKEDK